MDSAKFCTNENQLKESVKERDIPFCSCCLVLLIIVFHTMVMSGNMATASAFGSIGTSTKGWSNVGMGLADSLEGELEGVIKEVTSTLTEAIGQIMEVQNMLDFVVGFQSKSIDAVVSHNATKALVLLQAHGIMDVSHLSNGLSGMVTQAMTTSMQKLAGSIEAGIKKLLKLLKPALVQVGKFIIKFGEKVQNIIESFSVTLDRVQKIFDQVMASMAKKGANILQLEHETWHLFDTTNTGTILPQDLKNVASIYNIPALQGNKSDQLVNRYDADESGDLDKKEFLKMVHDKDVPNIMSVVLRSFAKSLAQVAGQVGGSKFRGEIAADVADYLELMTAKNRTKVAWISDALGNGSVPIEFVADVLASIALKVDDPNSHKSVPTGPTVIAEMMKIHPKETAEAIDHVSNATFWTSQGFSPSDQAAVVKRITAWSTQHHADSGSSLAQVLGMEEAAKLHEERSLDEATIDADGSVSMGEPTMLMERKLISVMEDLAYTVTAENMRLHLSEIENQHRIHNEQLLGSDTAKYLQLHLMGGERACKKKGHPNSPAAQSLKTQIPAAPETLKFAKWLSWNATNTARRFQKMAFEYQKTSSNAIDGFATQIQGMVKKVQGFIKMMMQYSTPDGIDALENTLLNYAEHALADMLVVTNKRVSVLMQQNAESSTSTNADLALHKKIANALAGPLGQGLAPSLEKELGKAATNEISDVSSTQLGKEISELLEKLADTSIASVTDSVGATVRKTSLLHLEAAESFIPLHLEGVGPVDQELLADLEKNVHRGLQSATSQSKLVQTGSELKVQSEGEDQVSGLMEDALQLLHSLTHVLPQATKALIFARKEVSMVGKTLDTIFKGFEKSGPQIFDGVQGAYGSIWSGYYFIMLPLPIALLFYAFWAGGYFGGPGRVGPEDGAPKTCWEKTTKCWTDCCDCFCGCHNYCPSICFWSVCLFLQMIVLILFLLAIVLTILAAVQMFLASGCAQIYLLADQSICGGVLQAVRDFLSTFLPDVDTSGMPEHCQSESLLTCELIAGSLRSSAMMTVLGSFFAAVFTFQMLIESATLHTRALSRLEIQKTWKETYGKAQ
jgi:hypothetical protein